MYERKAKATVNLVRMRDDDTMTYRVVDEREMLTLKLHGKVAFEKAREERRFIGSFYIQIED